MVGSLHLPSAMLAARADRSDDAWTHLREAQMLAQRTGERNAYELGFGGSNATVTGVTVAVELGEDTRALASPTTRPG